MMIATTRGFQERRGEKDEKAGVGGAILSDVIMMVPVTIS